MEASKEFCQHFYEFWKANGVLAAIIEEEEKKNKCSEERKKEKQN